MGAVQMRMTEEHVAGCKPCVENVHSIARPECSIMIWGCILAAHTALGVGQGAIIERESEAGTWSRLEKDLLQLVVGAQAQVRNLLTAHCGCNDCLSLAVAGGAPPAPLVS